MPHIMSQRQFTKLELGLGATVLVLVGVVIAVSLQPDPKGWLGSRVDCHALVGLHGTNKVGSALLQGVHLAPHTVVCEGQKVVGVGIAKGTVIESALETGHRVGFILLSNPTTENVTVFSTRVLRQKTGWFGSNGYFAPIGHSGLGYGGYHSSGGGYSGGGDDDGGD